MGGTINVESELGVGTKVSIEFENKITEPVLSNDKIEQTESLDLKGIKVLLAEDNEYNREIAIEILTDEGIEIDIAEDGYIAVEKMKKAKKGDYDLILMDIQMPRINGYEATKAIRNLSDTEVANIPIIAMTANAFEEDKKNAYDAKMNAHIAKPIDVHKLMNVLVQILKQLYYGL